MAAEVRPAPKPGRRNSLEELEAVALDVLSQVKVPTAAATAGSLPGASGTTDRARRKRQALSKAEVEQSRACPHCGNQVAAMYRSCRHCGHRVD